MIFNKTLISDLNENQKKLIVFLEKNSKNILNSSIKEIADENNVSSSFITKTLKKVGFFGWKDYRAFVIAKILTPNSSVGYLKYIQKNLYPSIDSSISNIDELSILELAEKIKDCKGFVFFVGQGFSYFIAQDQSRRYKKLGKKAIAINSSDYEENAIAKDDLVIIISASAYTESVLKTIKFLEANNIYFTLLTTNPSAAKEIKHKIVGRIQDPESNNEREFPKMSRFVLIVILDWIFTKYNRIARLNSDKN